MALAAVGILGFFWIYLVITSLLPLLQRRWLDFLRLQNLRHARELGRNVSTEMPAEVYELMKPLPAAPRPAALAVVSLGLVAGPVACKGEEAAAPARISVTRLAGNPIITPESDPAIGTNINGPSLIRVPKWIANPLGAYYLYFADHNGKYIRLAYADRLEGPWRIYRPGTLQLAQSFFTDHIASPEAVVDDERRQIRLYYHGLTPEEKAQHTRVALSRDGLSFEAVREPVGRGTAYWRLFRYGDWWYALAMPGRLWRSKDGITSFEAGPQLFPARPTQVHNAVLVEGDTLTVFYTRAGDTPERILWSRVRLEPDWQTWRPAPPEECLAPETEWEGAGLPLTAGTIGAVDHPIHALRDPAVFQEGGKTYLLYAVRGESGIGIAELKLPASGLGQ